MKNFLRGFIRYLRYYKIIPPLSTKGLKIGDKVVVKNEELGYNNEVGTITKFMPPDKYEDFNIQVTFSFISKYTGRPFIEYFVPDELEKADGREFSRVLFF